MRSRHLAMSHSAIARVSGGDGAAFGATGGAAELLDHATRDLHTYRLRALLLFRAHLGRSTWHRRRLPAANA